MKQLLVALGVILVSHAGMADNNTGTGWIPEGDVCSTQHWFDPSVPDSCASGLSCMSLSNGTDLSGVCCNRDAINSTLGDVPGYPSGWQTVNTRYQKRVQGYELCLGFYYTRTEYRCIAGYYGNPTNTSSGCTACPANATCPAGATTFSCNQGYYKNGSGCTACTAPGTTSVGAVAQTSCFIPSGTTGSDGTGWYSYVGNSYWCG